MGFLDLKDCGLSDDHLGAFGAALGQPGSNLRSLRFCDSFSQDHNVKNAEDGGTLWGGAGAAKLLRALGENKSLRSLCWLRLGLRSAAPRSSPRTSVMPTATSTIACLKS